MVEFQLLGDVEARSGGRRLDIGHARQKCVLAALLVDVNRAVSADQLIDRVWADEPPHRANNALSAYVSRLRLLLAQAGGTRIVRESGGYMLTTDTLSVDLHRFRHLASEARSTTDPVAAAPLLDDALGLWQGEPFGSLDTPWVNDVCTSLAAEHLSVELDRNDVCLRIGRHAELLGGLTASLQANLLDERLAGQLMLALYRSGRQADALETYRRMRERLVEVLGIDPSPALRKVLQQILDGDHVDPKPMSPAQPVPPGDGAALTGLPRRATRLIGRERDVRTVTTELAEGPLVTLTGVGGVGKTGLAIDVGERSADRFENGA
jgi:DNA-binding SARP family transcriptional activator